MKNILAENMLRFGVKNLKESDKQKIQNLSEQSNAQRNSQLINQQSNIAANLPDLRNRGIAATKGGYCIYTEVPGPLKPVSKEYTIKSIFYNNMVSSKGLMVGFDDFFDTPKFDFDKEKQLFVENLDMLKNMPVQEQTLYKKWKEVNGYYRNAMDKARIVKAKIWTPTDLTNKELTVVLLGHPTYWKRLPKCFHLKQLKNQLLLTFFCLS